MNSAHQARSPIPSARTTTTCITSMLALLCLASRAHSQTQVTFSVDFRGSTIARPDSGAATPITEGDVLRAASGQPAFGPLPAPTIVLNGGNLGIGAYPTCVGHTPGSPCGVEVDALSFGRDAKFDNTIPAGQPGRARIYFSVDRIATGVSNTGGPPNVFSEGANGANEAGADVFTPYATVVGPVGPGTPAPNVGVFDGNGLMSTSGALYRGFGLREFPIGPPPFDNIDALSIEPFPTGTNAAVYFSLDPAFTDPATAQPNSGSAQLQGVPPSAVLRRLLSGGSIAIYALPAQLGLSPINDDIDALILAENGDGVYQPSINFYDWLGGATDMLLFSVRRGSAVIGQSDSQFGVPIEPGDILAPPLTPGARPRIFIAAEELGLRTARMGHTLFGDDVDGLSTRGEPYEDCNHNGRDDAVDIALGSSSDSNGNNIPDECEQTYSRYCTCPSPLGPCGNNDATAGCQHSGGVGGALDGAGTTSVTTDDLVLSASRIVPSSVGLFFMGPTATQVAFGDGLRCVGSPTYRLGVSAMSALGTGSYGPGIVARSYTFGTPASNITSGTTWNFQLWYRNASAYCTPSTFNLTNGLSVVFTP